ncbi:LysR family transcriptional regulator [Actinocatenispora rupis]|uniref:HTH lysR-type domain-containing protein n=1 Tax=Actinocatenispora rupis TaxID=519421 RepID=A0A8J3J724_9ACTN|nr:LysR family transcriptional regulator [Actinocatenispora rupis]GID11337.1 hypothetical protein Aru02nite_22260 [Actinocatenispora rupis]
MATRPGVDDLQLVAEIARTGSIGAAARALRVSQPAASARLSRLERGVGTRLFERDTTGARPTAAGAELSRQAAHILGHLDRVFADTRTAGAGRPLVVGTFASLAASLFPVLDALPDVAVDQRVDHGDLLVEWVAEGTMDAAFVAIADQIALPRGLRAHPVGADELVFLRVPGVPAVRAGRQPLRGRHVVLATYDLRLAEVRRRLERLGADVRLGATLATTLGMARRSGHLAVLPRSAVAADPRPDERIEPLPFRTPLKLSLITPRPGDPRLLAALPDVRDALGLR